MDSEGFNKRNGEEVEIVRYIVRDWKVSAARAI